ncbi:hypothetical protein M8818_001382 [Zalaria obscura]|uniref:Uncharacterized protein n=1 Tax=Zalaria obscura TaxID=2024903 RepID=A0ACC3SN12_9PEZI
MRATSLALRLALLQLAASSPLPSDSAEDASSVTTTPNIANPNHIFNAIHSSMRQWGSSLIHNGMSFFLVEVPEGVELYHGTNKAERVDGMEWLAFEPEHAMIFARPHGPPHGKPGGGPPGGPPGGPMRGPPEESPEELRDGPDGESVGGPQPHGKPPGGKRPHDESTHDRTEHEKPRHKRPDHKGADQPECDHEKGDHKKADRKRPDHDKPDHKKPAYDKPDHKKADHDKPDHKKPNHDEPTHGERPHKKPSHDEPPHGKPPHGKPPHDGPPHDGPPHDGPPHDGPPHDGPPHGKPSHDGPPPFGKPPHDPHHNKTHDEPPHGPPPHGPPPHGPPPHDEPPHGPPLRGPPPHEKPPHKEPKKLKQPSQPSQPKAPYEQAPADPVPWSPGQAPLVPRSDSSDDEASGYLHTYRTKHALRLIYLDGQSAAKSTKGTLDTQDYVLSNSGTDPEQHFYGETERAENMCRVAHEEWGDRIDGVLRMEGGFEIILCSFAAHLDVASIKQVAKREERGPGGGFGGGGDEQFNYYRAVAARYDGIGGGRVVVDYENMVTAFADTDVLYFDEHKLPRIRNGTAAVEHFRREITDMVMAEPRKGGRLDWQAVADMIVTRYSDRLEYMTSGKLDTSETLHGEIDRALRPFIDYGYRNTSAEVERCAMQFWPLEADATTVAARAVFNVSTTLCSTLSAAAKEDDYDASLALIEELQQWLAWTSWKRCRGCGYHEVCFLPIWPMGTAADFEKPSCKSEIGHGGGPGSNNGYWDGFGGPRGPRGPKGQSEKHGDL